MLRGRQVFSVDIGSREWLISSASEAHKNSHLPGFFFKSVIDSVHIEPDLVTITE